MSTQTWRAMTGPTAELGLPAGEEDEANLEEALEQLMDDMVMPPVGKAPEDM